MSHHWSGWPGAWCMDCGMECVIESALCCPDCDLKCYDGDPATDTLCPKHQKWADTPCPEPGSGRFNPYVRGHAPGGHG